MQKNLMTSVLVFFLTMLSCLAQEVTKPQRWELGVDVLSLFNKNHYPAYSIFVARKLGENGLALRSRVGIEGSSFENLSVVPPRTPFPRPDNYQKRNYFASMGIQKALWINSKPKNQSYFYSGVDIAIKLNQEFSQKLEQVEYFTDFYFERKLTFRDYIVAPFLGYSYHLHKNFSVRTEIAFNLIITDFKVRGNGWYMPYYDQSVPFIPPINENPSAYEFGNSRTIDYRLSPLNQIILSYNF